MGGAVPPHSQCAFMAWCSVRGSTGKRQNMWTLTLQWNRASYFCFMWSWNL